MKIYNFHEGTICLENLGQMNVLKVVGNKSEKISDLDALFPPEDAVDQNDQILRSRLYSPQVYGNFVGSAIYTEMVSV